MEYSDRASSAEALAGWVTDARTATLDLVSDLDDDQLIGPALPTINPLLWEIGHAAWFQEKWVLQHVSGRKPIRQDDGLYDSIGIPHETRWDLPLPTRDSMVRYICQVRDDVLDVIHRRPLTPELVYFTKLSVFHEDMHTEAFTYTRQTLGYRAPAFSSDRLEPSSTTSPTAFSESGQSQADIDQDAFELGAPVDATFVFDNEKWAHPVSMVPFSIDRTAVTQKQFLAFVNDDGYRRVDLWCPDGRSWLKESGAQKPAYWRPDAQGGWMRRHFDRWVPLEDNLPMFHVNWYEANAYCRWAGRRLPTEAEWELAAGGQYKRHYPWGDDDPGARTHMDWQNMGPAEVAAHPTGDSDCGCRQMLGNVWEWTSTLFEPYPGFVADPYREYSRPCFGKCRVLRGGCWVTRSRLIRNTWRNYYEPHRRDVWAGFRTCAE